ncbi:MAG: Crp/Fnr family transcriptional regulator [Clostridia bacterium]|nr:Crp/Fnr family transcriptional regulator [Clostridia bacterium]MBQ2433354.1 Crp/Fnr family transcriptional regulator [Clostridia bacterium]MBQ5770398.1 Crp/Fnr family transcriptional regulator [Clostridia bacterium]
MEFKDYFPIWNKLSDDQKERLMRVTELRKAKAGTLLHDGGPTCLGMLLVKSGQIRAYILSDEGREVTVSRFFERDICMFSVSCAMPDMQFDIMIETEKDSEFWVLPACLYKNLTDESLAVANYSNSLISNHLSELMWLMKQIMWDRFDKRLAKFLLEESILEEKKELKITHEKIANHMGSAREVVTRMLKYFQDDGMVRLTRGAIEILSEEKLGQIAGD